MMKKIMSYFLRGLVFLIPIGGTVFIFYKLVAWLERITGDLAERFFEITFPGIGLVMGLVVIVLLGFVVTLLGRPFSRLIDRAFNNLPLIKTVYSALKDLGEAIFGDKRKFTEPVMVKISESGVCRMGFITQKDLSSFGAEDMVAVFCPHSYRISGNLYLVPKENVKLLDVSTTHVMKFIVSAGVTKPEEEEE